MNSLLGALDRHFEESKERFRVFSEQGVQVEGWFKGELLYFLDREAARGVIGGFDREKKGPKGVTDIYIEKDGVSHWVELKHWHIGIQKGQRYGAGSYFGQKDSTGIYLDVEKLSHVEGSAKRWLLILCTASPDRESWSSGIEKYNKKYSPHRLVAHSQPVDARDEYFIGLIEVMSVHEGVA